MILSDVSVTRPVFATVLSILLVAFGVLAFGTLPLREFPDIDPPIVSIDTTYVGASASIVDTRITEVLEDRISGIEGVRTIESTSQDGRSQINIEFDISRDVDDAANDVRDAVSRVIDNLPEEADPPEVSKQQASGDTIAWFHLTSPDLDTPALTDFAERYVVDRLSVVDGVARVRVGGRQRYSMRVWIDRIALAARGLTVNDVERVLREENLELPAGSIESEERDFTVRVDRGYRTAEDFRALVLSQGADGHLVRLGEVARVEIGSEEHRRYFLSNGQPMVGLGIVKQSTANTISVIDGVTDVVGNLRESLPPNIDIAKNFDASDFVRAAIDEVRRTFIVAMILVLLVIYVFLGSLRAAAIPAVTVPVSVIASFTVLALCGFSVNLMTLLALVISIGLVVDDSIVVLENIQRRVDMGEPRIVAAFRGARQVGFAVIATTLVIISVFLPIIFMEGNTGRIFAELAVAVSGAVAFSSLVALTLSATMCSKLLTTKKERGPIAGRINGFFDWLKVRYLSVLPKVISRPALVGCAILGFAGASAALMAHLPEELAPPEDRGYFIIFIRGPEGASFDYTVRHVQKLEEIIQPYFEKGEVRRVISRAPGSFGAVGDFNTGLMIVSLELWDDRERDGREIMSEVGAQVAAIPGVLGRPIMRQGFGGGFRQTAVQFVLGGTNYEELAAWRDIILEKASENPGLVNLQSDYHETKPQLRVEIDRTRAADLGVSVQEIGQSLETMLGSRRVTTYIDRGEEYDVKLQAQADDRSEPSDLTNIQVRSGRTGELIPLTNLVTVREIADASSLNRFNRLRSVTISANLAPGYALNDALSYLEGIVRSELPPAVRIDYKGQSREFKDASSSLAFTFILALVVVFLVLAAQFESFIHPFTIMLTVPVAIAGALAGLWLSGDSLNIYSQIGIIILLGLAAKNGILIVEFANQLRDEGKSVEAAVLEAADTRFRPIVMTGLSTSMGAVPLLISTGAGEASRASIGIVIFAGVLFATVVTLFVVPTFYRLLGRFTTAPGHIARQLERYESGTPAE